MDVCADVCQQIAGGEEAIIGVMVESHLVEGNQSLETGSRWPTVRASPMPASTRKIPMLCYVNWRIAVKARRGWGLVILGSAVKLAYPMNLARPDKSRNSHQANDNSIVSNKKADSLAVGFLIFKRMTFTSLYPGLQPPLLFSPAISSALPR